MPPPTAPLNSVLRNLPSVDELLSSSAGEEISSSSGIEHAAGMARTVIAELRNEIVTEREANLSRKELLVKAKARLNIAWRSEQFSGIHRVINATGVVIHTNLGRAPLSESARHAVAEAGAGYCTLEYDIEKGKRGKRGHRAENLLAELTGAESVLIVNNCAAAAFFVLTVFASGGEVIISRGEMVEIGGDFRVPDVLSQSGAKLREVGTTNRTKLADYENAINQHTRLILRVHPSNYRIVGFTATPSIESLVDLAHRRGIILYEDLGSGALVDLSSFGLSDEPVVGRSLSAGADIVTFSGDKLLGGPQAGIIAGKTEFVEQLRKHPLYRALRVDKLAYAALEATLDAYRRGLAVSETPVLRMLSLTKSQIAERAKRFVENIDGDLLCELIDGESAIGGGSAPAVRLETTLIGLRHRKMSVSKLEKALRVASPPVIARISDDRLVIDLRTVSETEEVELLEILTRASVQNPA